MTQKDRLLTSGDGIEAEVASLLTNWKAETVDSGLPTYVRLVIREVRRQIASEIEADRACHQELSICPGCRASRIARGVASS